MKRSAWTGGEWAIPKRILLPGLRIKVRVIPHEEMVKRYGSKYGVWVYDVESGVATIAVSSAYPIEVQRYTILHELLHAVNDLVDQSVEKFPEHVQTESMAKMIAFLSTATVERYAASTDSP